MAVARRLVTFFILGRCRSFVAGSGSYASQPARSEPAEPFSWRQPASLQPLHGLPALKQQDVAPKTLANPRSGEFELQQQLRRLHEGLHPEGGNRSHFIIIFGPVS
jgi:hypothetical protein